MSAKESLKETFRSYKELKIICGAARETAFRNPNYPIFREIILTDNTIRRNKKKNKRDIVNEYFDSLEQRITEHYIVEIVAVFEQNIFRRVSTAHGEIRKIVKNEYGKRAFHIAAPSFVKDQKDIYNLSGIKTLLENKIAKNLFEKFSTIIEHRNWLSHGKRIGVGRESDLTIEQIYEVLSEISEAVNSKK